MSRLKLFEHVHAAALALLACWSVASGQNTSAPAVRGETPVPARGPVPTPLRGLATPAVQPTVQGAVGLGSYATVVEYKELTVTAPDGKMLFQLDLSKGLGDWYFNGGQWKAVDNYLKQSTTEKDSRATIGDTTWTDYTVSVKARKVTGDEGFILLFRVHDANNYCWFNVGGWKNTKAQVERADAGTRKAIGPAADIIIAPDRWYDLKVEVHGETAKCYVDGKLLCQTDLSPAPTPVVNVARQPSRNGTATSQQARGNQATATASATASAPAPSANDRYTALDKLFRDPNRGPRAQGFADLKAYFVQDPINAEHVLWRLRALLPPLTDNIQGTLDLIQLAWAAKNRPDGDHSDPGYLYALEASCLFQQHKPQEAERKLQEGLTADPVHTSEELMAFLGRTPAPDDANSVLTQLLPAIAAAEPENSAVVEPALKLRIKLLDNTKRYTEALADAKSLFCICSMHVTTEALALLDQQLQLAYPDNPARDERFRQEQMNGANAPAAGAEPGRSLVFAAIAVDPAPYKEALAKLQDTNFQNLARHVSLLLLAGEAEEALPLAQRALQQAQDTKNSNEINLANELIARCLKTQAGTIGRANAFVGSIVVVASPQPARTNNAPAPDADLP